MKFFFLFSLMLFLSCSRHGGNVGPAISGNTVKTETDIVPTVCVYTFGKVRTSLRNAMLDSLRVHYPKVRYVRSLPLDKGDLTKKLNDHDRYLADNLNNRLKRYKTDTTIVIGLTSADIGKDNFRGHAHWGIMGLASGIGTGVAVFSSYRPHNNNELFGVMIHEIGHAEGLRHCPNTACMMQNAKGGNPFAKTHVFCKKCKAFMQKKHWAL